MKRLSAKAVLRAYLNAKRRRGGFRRLRYEVVMQHAWEMAWSDDFKLSPADYVSLADEFLREQERKMLDKVRKPKLRLVKG